MKWKSRLFPCPPKLPKHDSREGAFALPQGLHMGFWGDQLCTLHIIWFPGTNFDKGIENCEIRWNYIAQCCFQDMKGTFWERQGYLLWRELRWSGISKYPHLLFMIHHNCDSDINPILLVPIAFSFYAPLDCMFPAFTTTP